LIQEVKDLIEQSNVTICHTLKEENQCADFMAKLKAQEESNLSIYVSPPKDLLHMLKLDADATFFHRA